MLNNMIPYKFLILSEFIKRLFLEIIMYFLLVYCFLIGFNQFILITSKKLTRNSIRSFKKILFSNFRIIKIHLFS